MAYASYPQENPNQTPSFEQKKISTPVNKMLAKSFGYMALGLAVSAAVAFFVSYVFVYVLNWTSSNGDSTTNWKVGYLVTMGVSFVGLLISGVAMSVVMAKNKHSAWVPYLLYTAFMGVFLSSFLVMGIDFKTIGEALLLTGGAFLAMFFIGYFSKANMNVLGMVLSLFLTMLLFFALFWSIKILISGNALEYYLYDLVITGALLLVSILVVSIDAYNIKRILQRAEGMKNVALFCAYVMYCDFIIIFLRVLYILLLILGKKK
jgi:uncharacterized protein